MAKFCPDCGTAATGGKFCAECGFRFPDATTQAAPALAASTDSRWQNNNSFNGSFVGNTNGASAVPAWQQKQPSPAQFAQAAQVATAVAPMAASAAGYAANNNGSFIGNNTNGANATPAWQKQPSAAQFGQAAQVATAAAPMAAAYAANNNGSFIGNNTNGANATPAWQKQPSTTQFGQAAQGYSTSNAGTYGRSQPSPPMAVAMPATGGATAYGNGANGMASSDSNTSEPYKPPYMNATPPPPPPPEPVPPAASGAEAQQVYEQCVQTMRQSRGGNNENGVKTFKQNCRLYGLKQMDVEAFYDSLVQELGPDATLVFVPNLARLVPDDDRRKELVEYNATKRPPVNAPYANWGNRSSSSSVGSFRERSGSQPGAAAPASKGILKGRYADHPNCDICNVAFDVTKRRHHCRQCGLSVCNSCSPLRLLIPDGMQVAGAKGYDPSIPQRVCIQCAPGLHQYQDQLVAQHAQANEDNAYTAQGRLVHVPFSNSLFKECQNAADIIGNFFRDDWGAAADRSIPVAFLQKAHGLAVLSIIKAGFLITGQIGTGLVVAKLPDGSWSAPSAIGLGGLGGGFEIGGEMVELMIILGSQGAVKVFHKPQANIGAGLDLAVGPYGRSAVAAAAVSTSGLNANYSYSHSKGFFAGISLQGKIIAPRNDLNRKFYGRDLQPGEILSGHIAAPNAARPLYEAIEHAMQGIDQHRDSVSRRSSLMGPCRMCNCPMFVAHTKQVWNKNCKTCKHVH